MNKRISHFSKVITKVNSAIGLSSFDLYIPKLTGNHTPPHPLFSL